MRLDPRVVQMTSERRIATPFREILQHDRMTALLVAPIRRDERVLGTLHIYRERGHAWRDDAHLLAAGLADQAAMAIENATRYAGLQDSLELAMAVRDVWPGTRFILVTGWGGSIDPAEVEPLGVEAVIAKPYCAPELRERINART